MKYELALKLEEAGFKVPSVSNREGYIYYDGGIEVYIPSLSELIESCKEDFYSLHRLVHRPLEQERWQVRGVKTKSTEHIVYGSTPEEAVAHLLIALSGGNIKQWMEKNIGTGKEKI